MSAHIRFLCPTCKAVMSAPVAHAGKKINCLNCGQRLQIPPADRSKTILAPGLGVDDAPSAQSGGSSAPSAAGIVGGAALPLPAIPPPLPASAPPPAPPLGPHATHRTNARRGWAIPASIWLMIAICASCLNGCADLGSIVGTIAGHARAAPARAAPAWEDMNDMKRRNSGLVGRPNQGQQTAAAGMLLGVAFYVVLGVIWLGVHWLLIWRRLIDLEFPIYRVWTGLHIGWTSLALVGLLVALYFLSVLFTLAGQMGAPTNLTLALWVSVLSTILNLLATVGWVVIVIAVPARQSESTPESLAAPADQGA